MDRRRQMMLERLNRQSQVRVEAVRRDTRWIGWMAFLALLVLTTIRFAHAADTPIQVLGPSAAVKVKGGQTVTVPVTVKIAKGWHVFGAQPLIAGVRPASIALVGAAGVTALPVALPAATKIHVAPLQADANVYESDLKVPLRFKVDKSAKPGARTVNGTFSYQACSDQKCLFPKKLTFSVPITVVK
jgi:DsbC/DsbD-like thiol-disulfide interchange protein